MSRIGLNTNIAAINAQRQLEKSSSQSAQISARLSSGLRINSAADDAAGLAISSALKASTQVYGQAVRNINDAISTLHIENGAISELTNILTRQKELATQAANGVLSFSQRKALNEEANALVNEYNRILESTEFNGQKLIDGSLTELRIQLGFGANGSIAFLAGEELKNAVGNGEFELTSTFTAGNGAREPQVADFNNDGRLDYVVIDPTDNRVRVALANEDSGFSVYQAVNAPNNGNYAVGDFDGDGNTDVVTNTGFQLWLYSGNGDGTLSAAGQSLAGATPVNMRAADVNGDGNMDIIGNSGGDLAVYLGNGDGTMRTEQVFTVGSLGSDLEIVDLNNDGNHDVVYTSPAASSQVNVFLGNGAGEFSYVGANSMGNNSTNMTAGDINNDGIADIITADMNDSTLSIRLGKGDGTFGTRTTLTAGTNPVDIKIADINGDGIQDLINSNGSSDVKLFIGNGDGTYQDAVNHTAGGTFPGELAVADFNQDSAIDFVLADAFSNETTHHFADTQELSRLPRLRLYTAEEALETLDFLDGALERIGKEKGGIGSYESRFQFALNTILATISSYQEANSRITNADVAFETANLVRSRVIQNSNIAILAQANLQPTLALQLLELE